MELEMRDPSTTESTYPFPRYFGLPDWLERWEPLRRLADQRDAAAIPVEEYVEDDHLVIRAELPGVDPDKDISVSVDAGVLHISAERREQHEERKPDRYRSELRYGAFSRAIRLPADAGAGDVEASYADGILTVRLPIDPDRAERTRIPVRRH
jgi:HSP20 family protein